MANFVQMTWFQMISILANLLEWPLPVSWLHLILSTILFPQNLFIYTAQNSSFFHHYISVFFWNFIQDPFLKYKQKISVLIIFRKFGRNLTLIMLSDYPDAAAVCILCMLYRVILQWAYIQFVIFFWLLCGCWKMIW